jgi:hypothetical protein
MVRRVADAASLPYLSRMRPYRHTAGPVEPGKTGCTRRNYHGQRRLTGTAYEARTFTTL